MKFLLALLLSLAAFAQVPAVNSGTATYPTSGVIPSSTTSAVLNTGTTIATPAASDNSTALATTAYVTTGIANAVTAAAGRDVVQAATAAVLPNTPTFTHVDAGVGSFYTSSTNSVLVVDGYTPLLLDRILVKNQAAAANNGIYSVTQLGVAGVTPWILTRTLDYDQPADMNNTWIPVGNNGTQAGSSWIMNSKVVTVDTDAVNFGSFTPNGANIVTAVSPGVGLCHFAGSTQTCTSSAVALGGADVSGVLLGANGGTGIANTGFTITLAGNLVTTGAFNTTFAQGGTATMTLPTTSATLARTDAGQTFTGTQVFSSPILGTSGGTGVNNGAFTITLAGNLATTGAFNTTFAQGATTTQTLPTTSQTIPGMNQTNTAGSSMVWDLSAASTTAGLKIPAAAGAVPTADDFLAMNTTNHTFVWGSNGTTEVGAVAATGTGTATTCTNQFVSAVSSLVVPTCSTVVGASFGSAVAARAVLANATAAAAAPSFSTTADTLAYQVAEIPSQVEVCSAGGTGCATGSFTTSGVGTALELITGLSFTLPGTTALNIPIHCHLIYHQNSAAVNVNFGYQDATTAATNFAAQAIVQTAATTIAYANLTASSTTTATSITGSFLPSAITTNWLADIYGYIEQPSGTASVFSLRVSTATAADTVTIVRGSFCAQGVA